MVAMTAVTLKSDVRFDGEIVPSSVEVDELHDLAHTIATLQDL